MHRPAIVLTAGERAFANRGKTLLIRPKLHDIL
jgi:hypothetical protein